MQAEQPDITARRKLRIGHIAPLFKRIPPEGYGGTERCIATLTEKLVYRGHDVTLFASGNSRTSAALVSVTSRSLTELADQALYRSQVLNSLHVANAYKRQEAYDLFIDHTRYISLPTANQASIPVIHPLHWAIDAHNTRLFQACQRVHYVGISHAQTQAHPEIRVAATIYHGLDMEHFPFGAEPESEHYLLTVGRISWLKGTHIAIEVASALGMPLYIAGKLDTSLQANQDYFEAYVKPRIDGRRVVWVGEVNEDERNLLMKGATALLHPVTWPEPFGLVLIEAMACGCPVVGFARGSLPEVVREGVSGFVVQTVGELIDKVKDIGTINRLACRSYALERFNADRMVDQYERLFSRVLTGKVGF